MYLIDGHMHLEYGPLTVEYVLKFVEQAVEKGISEIQILDHTHRFKEFEKMYESLYFVKQQEEFYKDPERFRNTLDEYEDLIKKVKSLDLPIKVKFGLEVCYRKQDEDFLRDILSKHHFDFLIGSVHSVDGLMYDMSYSKDILWNIIDKNVIYKHYYEELNNLVNSNLFDQVGHPDTIKLFNIYPDYDLTKTYEELADNIKKHHLKAECNVGCFYRYNHKDLGLSDELLKIFVDKGVELITVSDAHYPKYVGNYILEATKRIESFKNNIK